MDVMIEHSLSEKLNERESITCQVLISQILDKIGEVLPGLLSKKVVISQINASNTTLKSIKTNDVIPAMFIKATDKDTKKVPMVLLAKQAMVRTMIDAIMGLEEKNETASYQFDEFDLSTAQEMIARLFQDSTKLVAELANKPLKELAPSLSVFKNFGDFLQTMRLTSDAPVSIIQWMIQLDDSTAMPMMAVVDFKAALKFIQELGDIVPPAARQSVEEPVIQAVSEPAEQKQELDISMPVAASIQQTKEEPVIAAQTASVQTPIQQTTQPPIQQTAAQATMHQAVQASVQQSVSSAHIPTMMQETAYQPEASEPEPFFSVPAIQDNSELLMNVPLTITVEIGQTKRKIKDILEFQPGTIIELEKQTGSPMDVIVDGSLFARGEVVVIDENFGIRLTELSDKRKQLRQK